MKNTLEQFLIELALLTQKYNIEVHGCGCCDALRITNEEGEWIESIAKELIYDKEEKKYETTEAY
jgi:hypothetical protein